MARRDGTIHAAEVAPVAEACRRSPEQVRSCLRRLVADGLFAREGTGPRAVYRPTPAGLAALGGAALHNGLDVSPGPWGKDVVAAADRLGVAEHLTLATTESLQVGGV